MPIKKLHNGLSSESNEVSLRPWMFKSHAAGNSSNSILPGNRMLLEFFSHLLQNRFREDTSELANWTGTLEPEMEELISCQGCGARVAKLQP